MKALGTILPTRESLSRADSFADAQCASFRPLHDKARQEAIRVTKEQGDCCYWTSDTACFIIGQHDGKRRNFELRGDGHLYAKR